MQQRRFLLACVLMLLAGAHPALAQEHIQDPAPEATPAADEKPFTPDATPDAIPPAAPPVVQDMPSDEMPAQQVEEILYTTDDAPTAKPGEPGAAPETAPAPETKHVEVDIAPGEQEMTPLGESSKDVNTATFRVLNKLLGRAETLEAKLNEPARAYDLELTLKRCMDYPIINKYGDRALVQLVELKTEREIGTSRDVGVNQSVAERIDMFTGWLFERLKNITAVEHPVYDVTLVRCGTESKRIKKLDKPDEKKKPVEKSKPASSAKEEEPASQQPTSQKPAASLPKPRSMAE